MAPNFKLPLLNRNGSPAPAILALLATGGGAFYLYKKRAASNMPPPPGPNPDSAPQKEINGNVYTNPPPTGEADFIMRARDQIKSKMPKTSPSDDQRDVTNTPPKN